MLVNFELISMENCLKRLWFCDYILEKLPLFLSYIVAFSALEEDCFLDHLLSEMNESVEL